MADVCRELAHNKVSHTPFCDRDCSYKHHDLITILFTLSSHSVSRPGSYYLLTETLRRTRASGWNQNTDVVPDECPNLQCPLMYLACAFGRHKAVQFLVDMGFDPLVRNQSTGESVLHGAIRHIYQSGSWSSKKTNNAAKMRPSSRAIAFTKTLSTLTTKAPWILGIKDNNFETVFHVAAEKLCFVKDFEVSQGSENNEGRFSKHGASGGKKSAKTRQKPVPSVCREYYEQCFKALVTTLDELEDKGALTAELVYQIMHAKNRAKTSALDLLLYFDGSLNECYKVFKALMDKIAMKLFMGEGNGSYPLRSCLTSSSDAAPDSIIRQPRLSFERDHLATHEPCDPSTSTVHVVFGSTPLPQNASDHRCMTTVSLPESCVPVSAAIVTNAEQISVPENEGTTSAHGTCNRTEEFASNRSPSNQTCLSLGEDKQSNEELEPHTKKLKLRTSQFGNSDVSVTELERVNEIIEEGRGSFRNPCSVTQQVQGALAGNEEESRGVGAEREIPQSGREKTIRNIPLLEREKISAIYQETSNAHGGRKTQRPDKNIKKNSLPASRNNSSSYVAWIDGLKRQVAGETYEPLRRLKRQYGEACEMCYRLERQCFDVETERLDCVAEAKDKEKQIQVLKEEMLALERKSADLGSAKLNIETQWREAKKLEETLRGQINKTQKQ